MRRFVPALLAACMAAAPLPAAAFLLWSEEQERQIGAEEHPKMVAEFGGVYDEGEIGFWAAEIGARLVRNAGGADQSYTFTVLDSPVVNAFALPGGYVYVTRGLIALMNTEAELAGVLGHEIGHVTARHSAHRQGRATIANVLLGVLGAATGSEGLATQVGGLVGAGLLAQYTQEQEFEADRLGIASMAAAGWNSLAQADLLSSLLRESQLAQQIAGSGGPDAIQEFFASHPNTLTRVQRARATAQQTGGTGQDYGRASYLRHVDGMLWGDSPKQGYVRGQRFLHPDEGFAFEAPQGFRLVNQPAAVVAGGPNGARMVFDIAAKPRYGEPYEYLVQQWGAEAKLGEPQRLQVNGMPAATATATVQSQSGNLAARLVVLRHPTGRLYRMLFVAPPDRFPGLRQDFERAIHSFRVLPEAEARTLQPLRLRIVTVAPGDSVASLAARMAVEEHKEERFRVLNALEEGQTLRAGEQVKIVSTR